VSANRIPTCQHVIKTALHTVLLRADESPEVLVSLVGVEGQPTIRAVVQKFRTGSRPDQDLALLKVVQGPRLLVPPMEFASAESHLHFGDIKARDRPCHALKTNAARQIASGNCLFVGFR
jgi:hypothetical protein